MNTKQRDSHKIAEIYYANKGIVIYCIYCMYTKERDRNRHTSIQLHNRDLKRI